MLSWTYALKQEDSSLFTPHFPGKRQCYPGIDSQKDYKPVSYTHLTLPTTPYV